MVDDFVWNEAAIQIRKWKNQYGIAVPVSVNVSRIDILDSELESKLDRILKKNDSPPFECCSGLPLISRSRSYRSGV